MWLQPAGGRNRGLCGAGNYVGGEVGEVVGEKLGEIIYETTYR